MLKQKNYNISYLNYKNLINYILIIILLLTIFKSHAACNVNYKNLIVINIKQQKLYLYNFKNYKNYQLIKSYSISTSKKGPGQLMGSQKTPIGLHKINAKIGHNVPHYGIFKHRVFTNNIWHKPINLNKHKKDFIVTRILRLQGLEPGVNRGKNNKGQNIDSFSRAIYIHGTTMEWKLGTQATIGCIHMSSKDIVELFDLVEVGTIVKIC